MSDILCLYYSRSGNTRQTMAEIAKALEAELVEFTDGVDRQGRKGYFRSGWMPCGAPPIRWRNSRRLSPWRNTDW